MAHPSDTPGVIAPPPLIALAALVLGLALDQLIPAYILTILLPFHMRILAALILAAAGARLAWKAARGFRSAGTNVEPWKPTVVLVTTGSYQHLRNPIYVGLGLITAAVAVALASDWTLALIVPAAIALHYGVVLREERYLEAKFGDDYRRYKAAVPRYGIKI